MQTQKISNEAIVIKAIDKTLNNIDKEYYSIIYKCLTTLDSLALYTVCTDDAIGIIKESIFIEEQDVIIDFIVTLRINLSLYDDKFYNEYKKELINMVTGLVYDKTIFNKDFKSLLPYDKIKDSDMMYMLILIKLNMSTIKNKLIKKEG